jgi:hypothetical protein
VRELRDGRHQLLAPLIFYSAELHGELIAPEGTISNYADTPFGSRNLFPQGGPWKWAAVMHDAASEGQLVTPTGRRVHLVKPLTDRLFREAMTCPPCDRVPHWKRWVMYRAVVAWGSGAYGGREAPGAGVS